MPNPYQALADRAFWRRAMSGRMASAVDPVDAVPFTIGPNDAVATAGSCFAQHISRILMNKGFSYLVTETGDDPSYGVFPARFANIYTVRQLRQLFERAYGMFAPVDDAWAREKGSFVDPFRPRITEAGFPSAEALREDRDRHFEAIRAMFENCNIFVFTLGLTEAWMASADGAIVPFVPGAVGCESASAYEFKNFTVAEVEADLLAFIDLLRSINPLVRIILTVSPVALIATYEQSHVLVATTYSKSVLRVAAETASRSRVNVAYFPSYEIITGPHTRGAYYEDDLREVRPEAVSHVMDIFARHYLTNTAVAATVVTAASTSTNNAEQLKVLQALQGIICDESALDIR